ncbi:MAG: hypothetical protein ABSF33_04485 [Acidimicrobiales bacterium]
MSAIVAPGCGAVNAAKRAVHDIEGNKATIDTFTNKVKAGEASAFEATYVTTGSTPATIVYAVRPPNGLSFTETPSAGAGAVDIVVNQSGEFSCSPPAAGSSTWSCQKLAAANASTENQIFGFYTPAHWITFLRDFSLAAGLAGDKVTSSTMTVNGFNLQCVDVQAGGVPGTSTICSTDQGILGYVKVATDATSFEIKSYSGSPPPSLFETPTGATIISPAPTTTP